MHATRAEIRHYVKNMLIDEVDVGERVYMNRGNSPIFLEELPCLCIHLASEENDMISGSENRVKEYQRNLSLVVTLVAEEDHTQAENLNETSTADDQLDYLSEQVERAFFNDWRLGERLDASDPRISHEGEGLSFGHRFVSTTPYDVQVEGERRAVALDMLISIPYSTAGYTKKKFKDWLTYRMDIVRVGSTPATTDRELMSAEGEIND